MPETSRYWRMKEQLYGLVGEGCESCETRMFPPRDNCLTCEVPTKQKEFTFTGNGKVYSHTTIYDAPAGFEQFVPYTVALVKLDEGPLVTAQLTDIDPDEVAIGREVEMVTRKLFEPDGEEGMIVYGYKFRPIIEEVYER